MVEKKTMTAKERVARALEVLPEDATIYDAIDVVYVLMKIERGEAQADAGDVLTHEEFAKQMKRWLD